MRIHGGSRGLALSVLFFTAVALVACGQTTTGGLGGQSQGSREPTATPGAATGATSTSTAATGSQVAPTPGQVTVSLLSLSQGAQTVATSEAITVEIANGLTSTIITTDHHTDCTMVTLEQQVSGAWQPVDRCLIMAATRMIPIAGGQTVKQILTPQSGLTSRSWPAGTYRVAFGYSVGSETTPGSGATAYSATFAIG